MSFRLPALIVLAALLLGGCALSGEPEIAAEMPLPTPIPEITVPDRPPDLAVGAAFYAEHCAECHGDSGAGDGVMVRDGRLQTPPPDFRDPATVRDQTLTDYVRAITEGNVMAGMPPFARYSAEERWAVAAYVYTGWLSPAVLARGAEVYTTECLSCHGPGGAGDGPEAPEIMPDLSDLRVMSARSDADLYQITYDGARDSMPAFGSRLSQVDLWAVVGYLRSLTVVGAPGFLGAGETQAQAPAATEVVAQATAAADQTAAPGATDEGSATAAVTEEAPQPETITVTGHVTNGTAGGAIPVGATLTLHMFDPPEFAEANVQTTLNPDGSYTFADVPHRAERSYLVSMEYQDVFFSSAVYALTDPVGAAINTAVEIFDLTTDPSVVQIEAGVMRVTFGRFGLEVGEVLSFANTSDRLYLTEEHLTASRRVALRIPLPPGATGLGFEPGLQGSRLFFDEEQGVVIDTQPLRPGSDQIFFSYLIPYTDGAIIEQEFAYPFNGEFHLLIETGQVQFESPMFRANGERVDMGGSTFDAYLAEVSFAPGEAISYTLTGMPAVIAAAQNAGQSQSGLSPLVLILVIVGLVLIGAGGFMFLLRQESGRSAQKAADALLDQIAQLDDQHDQGMLNHDYYQRRRAELKAKLAELMRRQDEDAR